MLIDETQLGEDQFDLGPSLLIESPIDGLKLGIG